MVLHEAPVPRPTGEGEVLLRNHRCGICGSDLHWFTGETPAPAVCPGHEIVASVAGLGPGVSGLREGDRVAVEGIRSCGACAFCTSGRPQICPQLRFIGMTLDGGFADYVVTDARHVYPVPSAIDDEVASLTEPLAVCVHALRMAKLSSQDRVLILGAGTIGLLAVSAAVAAGATEIVISARRPHQRKAALALGASRALAEEDLREELARDREGFGIVLDTITDAGSTLETALGAVRPGGTVSVLGVARDRPPLDALRLMMLEIRLMGSMCYGRTESRADFEVALDILERRGSLLRGELVTHRFALADAAEAFRIAADKSTGSIKVCVEIFDPDSAVLP